MVWGQNTAFTFQWTIVSEVNSLNSDSLSKQWWRGYFRITCVSRDWRKEWIAFRRIHFWVSWLFVDHTRLYLAHQCKCRKIKRSLSVFNSNVSLSRLDYLNLCVFGTSRETNLSNPNLVYETFHLSWWTVEGGSVEFGMTKIPDGLREQEDRWANFISLISNLSMRKIWIVCITFTHNISGRHIKSESTRKLLSHPSFYKRTIECSVWFVSSGLL